MRLQALPLKILSPPSLVSDPREIFLPQLQIAQAVAFLFPLLLDIDETQRREYTVIEVYLDSLKVWYPPSDLYLGYNNVLYLVSKFQQIQGRHKLSQII